MIDIDPITYRIIYKGVDIGVTSESIQELRAYFGIDVESMLESLYNQHPQVIRDKKIEEIIN